MESSSDIRYFLKDCYKPMLRDPNRNEELTEVMPINWLKGHLTKTSTPEILRSRLVSFLKEHALVHEKDEPLVSSGGNPIRWLLDSRIALFDPEISLAIASLCWDYMEKFFPFQICCLEMTGIPLMVSVQAFAMRRGFAVNGFVIRKERKSNGRQRQIEGTITNHPIMFMDDIINSGDSIERASVALSRHDRKIDHIIALVDFGTSPVGEQLLQKGIHLQTLIRLEELGVSKSNKLSPQISKQFFREVWKFCPDSHKSFHVVPKSTPAIDDHRIYFGRDNGSFYALDRITGRADWVFSTGPSKTKGIRSSPWLEEDLIYFGAYDGTFYALDSNTGSARWQFAEADWIGSSPCSAPHLNCIFVGLEHALPRRRGSLIALDLLSGHKRWEFDIPALVHGSPLFIEELGCVVVGSNGGSFYCVDASTGELRWCFDTGGAFKSRPCYDEKRKLIISGSFDKAIYAWDVRTGKLVWKTDTGGYVYSEPLISGDYVYICSTDKYLHVLQAQDGAHVKRFYADAKLLSSPCIGGTHVYFASTGGSVFEFDPETHSHVGTHFIGEIITNKIVCDASNNLFYITTVDGQVVACEHS
jgi:outer membrane protein assembly factor BamB